MELEKTINKQTDLITKQKRIIEAQAKDIEKLKKMVSTIMHKMDYFSKKLDRTYHLTNKNNSNINTLNRTLGKNN